MQGLVMGPWGLAHCDPPPAPQGAAQGPGRGFWVGMGPEPLSEGDGSWVAGPLPKYRHH